MWAQNNYSPASDSTYSYFNGCANEADVPQISGLGLTSASPTLAFPRSRAGGILSRRRGCGVHWRGDRQQRGWCISLRLDLDLAPNFEEVGRRKIEQIDGSRRVAEQEGKQQQPPPPKPSASFAGDNGVVFAEIDAIVEIDGAAEIFCCAQRGRQIRNFDEAVVDGQVPKAFKDPDEIEAI